MPRKKKRDPEELDDRDLFREVFPKRVANRIEKELLADDDDEEPSQKES